MVLKQSIQDYVSDSEDLLLRDLINDELKFGTGSADSLLSNADSDASFASSMAKTIEEIGWIISNCDENSSEAVTAQDEFERLNVLKKYSAMDLTNDETLKTMTSMASSLLNHEYSWVLLMDLRKSWIISSHGLGGMSQCPRNAFFPCAHALRAKHPVMVVNDLTKDPRFVDSVFANGPLKAKFYAAAPLISPEGFRIGVFGVASRTSSSMSLKEQDVVKDFAELAMRHLVERRTKLDLQEKLKMAVTCTSHDIMTPLMGLQLSLASLREDKGFYSSLSHAHRDLLSTADTCVTTMCQLGTTAMQSVHEGLSTMDGGFSDVFPQETDTCCIADLVDRLHQVSVENWARKATEKSPNTICSSL